MPAIRRDAKRGGWRFWTPSRVASFEEIETWESQFGAIYCAFRRDGWSTPRLQVVLPPKDPNDARAARRFEAARSSAIPGWEFVQTLRDLGLRVMLDTDGFPHTVWDPDSPVDAERQHANHRRGSRPSRRSRAWSERGHDYLAQGGP